MSWWLDCLTPFTLFPAGVFAALIAALVHRGILRLALFVYPAAGLTIYLAINLARIAYYLSAAWKVN